MKFVAFSCVQCSLFRYRYETTPLFGTLESCNESYEKLYAQCVHDGKIPYADDSTIKKGEVGEPSVGPSSPSYHPPTSEGNPDEDGWDYLHHGEDWTGLCQEEKQSPIDIAKDVDIQGQTKLILWFDYYADPDRNTKPVVPLLENRGHAISFATPDNLDLGFVKLFRDEYKAKAYDFHSPSEHTIDGATFPLELQILNVGKDGKMLAVAFFFREGPSNKFLDGIKRSVGDAPRWKIAAVTTLMNKHIEEAFNLNLLVPTSEQHPGGQMSFYNYEGSLTQPPCTGGVDWWVAAKPLTATKEEIGFIRRAILESESMKHGNNRETQPSNGRSILVGMTNFQHAVRLPFLGPKQDAAQQPRGYSSQDAPWKKEM